MGKVTVDLDGLDRDVAQTTSFKQGGIEALGSVEATKNGANFTAAEFATPAEAQQVARPFGFLERNGLPLDVVGTKLFYATKCCTDKGPPPVVPNADFDAFKSAIG